jgi:hypothetical protein
MPSSSAHCYADSFTGRSRELPYFTSGAYRQVLIFLLKRLVFLPHPCIEIITPGSAQFMHLIDRVIMRVSSDQIIMKDVAQACSRLPGLLVTIRTLGPPAPTTGD